MQSRIRILFADKITNKISMVFIDLFVSLYLIELSGYDIIPVSTYWITQSIFIFTASYMSRNMLKKKSRKMLFVSGKAFQAIYMILLVVLKERSNDYVLLIGALRGISGGLYYNVHNIWECEGIDTEHRDNFLGIYKAVQGVLNIVLPILSGFLIALYGYSIAFMLIIVITCIHILIGLLYKDTLENTEIAENNKSKLIDTFKEFMQNSNYRTFALSYLLAGCTWSDGAMCTLIILYTTKLYTGSLNLGDIETVCNVFTILFGLTYAKCIKSKYAYSTRINLILCTITAICALCTVWEVAVFAIIVFNITSKLYRVVEDIEVSFTYYELSNDFKDKRSEYIILSELYLVISRVAGYIVLIIGVTFNYKLLLSTFALAILIKTLLVNKLYIRIKSKI